MARSYAKARGVWVRAKARARRYHSATGVTLVREHPQQRDGRRALPQRRRNGVPVGYTSDFAGSARCGPSDFQKLYTIIVPVGAFQGALVLIRFTARFILVINFVLRQGQL